MAVAPLFHQLFEPESSTYTYLLADPQTHEAVIIDPVLETAQRDLDLIRQENYKLVYILETHLHADHITGAWTLKTATGAQIAIGEKCETKNHDVSLRDGEVIQFGQFGIQAMATPGHTEGCMTYHLQDMVFTGDSLMIQAAGRTDFQGGSAVKLFESISKIFDLPPRTRVYPAHDYKGRTHSTVEEERQSNPRIGGKSKTQFVEIMDNLNLPKPKKIDIALPANRFCGDLGRAKKEQTLV